MASQSQNSPGSKSPDYPQLQIPSPSSSSSGRESPASIEILTSPEPVERTEPRRRSAGRKGVTEYLEEFHEYLQTTSVLRDGKWKQVLTCRLCDQAIGNRSDRIRDHLASKRHYVNENKMIVERIGNGQPEGNPTLGQNLTAAAGVPGLGYGFMQPGKVYSLIESQQYGVLPGTKAAPAPKIPITKKPGSKIGLRGTAAVGRKRPNAKQELPGKAANCNPTAADVEEGTRQMLCIRWNNRDMEMCNMFSQYLDKGQFLDVTLYCEGQMINCHRVVLAAASPYFERVFLEHQEKFPVIFMKDLELWQAKALLEFIYKGETLIENEQLIPLVRAAATLQIKAMSGYFLNGLDQDIARGSMNPATGSNNSPGPGVIGNEARDATSCLQAPCISGYVPGSGTFNHAQVSSFQWSPSPVCSLQPQPSYGVGNDQDDMANYPLPLKKRKFPDSHNKSCSESVKASTLADLYNPTWRNAGLRPIGALNLSTASEGNSGSGDSDDDKNKMSTENALDYSTNTSGANEQLLPPTSRRATASAARTMSIMAAGCSGSDDVESPETPAGESLSGSDFWLGFSNYQRYEGIMKNLVPRSEAGSSTKM